MKSIRRGISFDGLPLDNILDIIPQSLRKVILTLLQKIFFGKYPSEWKMQMLRAVTKPGYTLKDPQLRGIVIAPPLCKIYDTIIDNGVSIFLILWIPTKLRMSPTYIHLSYIDILLQR